MLTGRCQPPPVTWAGGVCFTPTNTHTHRRAAARAGPAEQGFQCCAGEDSAKAPLPAAVHGGEQKDAH